MWKLVWVSPNFKLKLQVLCENKLFFCSFCCWSRIGFRMLLHRSHTCEGVPKEGSVDANQHVTEAGVWRHNRAETRRWNVRLPGQDEYVLLWKFVFTCKLPGVWQQRVQSDEVICFAGIRWSYVVFWNVWEPSGPRGSESAYSAWQSAVLESARSLSNHSNKVYMRWLTLAVAAGLRAVVDMF